MRLLGITIKGVNGSTGLVNNTRSNSTMAELVYEWNEWETQTMVLLSFMLQLFLLATGSLRRRNTNGVLRAFIWLGYVGADFVAVYALGLFSQYEDKYKLGRESFGDTLPFLWVPFLLAHLGGQDSITAFSIEDNNLWLRHLLNLASQGVLALYVFWKSFHRINYSILIPAMLVFVSGIIKYGERVWALKSASRNGLGESVKLKSPPRQNNINEIPQIENKNINEVYPSKESYALQIALLARGLFVGRTVLQLGDMAHEKLKDDFKKMVEMDLGRLCYRDEAESSVKKRDEAEIKLKMVEMEIKLKMVEMELGMLFDLLYTKATVLQRWTGVLFRCASQTFMVIAFLLFVITEKGARHNHNNVNVAITYTLFTGAIFMEACSVCVVMASPWTRARLKETSFLHGLCNFATSLFKAVQSNKRYQSSNSTSMGMGQFNLMDYGMAMKCNPTIMSKAICAIGLDKQWRNLWYVYHIDDASRAREEIISGVMKILSRPRGEWFEETCFSLELNFILGLPFEHALYRLHLHTELYISKPHFASTNSETIMRLKEECETLSNYMMYLMVVRPSMLPVSTAAEDLEPELLKQVSNSINRHKGPWTKVDILDEYTGDLSKNAMGYGLIARFPFDDLPSEPPESSESDDQPSEPNNLPSEPEQEKSLTDIREMWLRLLMYVAGKCRGEVHARQLGEGGELITFVWLLMLHHGIGDVAQETELSLLSSDIHMPLIPPPGSTVSRGNSEWGDRKQETSYAFTYRIEELDSHKTFTLQSPKNKK